MNLRANPLGHTTASALMDTFRQVATANGVTHLPSRYSLLELINRLGERCFVFKEPAKLREQMRISLRVQAAHVQDALLKFAKEPGPGGLASDLPWLVKLFPEVEDA